MKSTLLSIALLALQGCASLSGDIQPFAPIAPATSASTAYAMPAADPAVAAANTGSIYRGSPGMRLFQDAKAHDVGDLLTIVLEENTIAKTTATTSVTKDSNLKMSAPSVLGAPLTRNGRALLDTEADSARDFSGKGDSAQSNRLQGSVTVTVVQRQANGNLVVEGQKQLRLNQGDELVQIQGVVRPVDIGPDNTIASSRVGQARIAYGGRGTVARSNAMGWLSRFFNSPIYPQ